MARFLAIRMNSTPASATRCGVTKGRILLLPPAVVLAIDCFNCTNTGNKFVSQTTYGQVPRRSAGGPVITAPNANFGNPNNPGTPFTGQVSVRYDF
jgi:hypothetical protein